MIRIKAAPGRNVRDPGNRNRVMPQDGIDVAETDPYWFTKIQRGDVVVVPALPAAKIPVPPAPQAAASPPSLTQSTTAVTGTKPNSQE